MKRDKLNQIFEDMKKKPYSQKEEWEKFLSNDISKTQKRLNKQKKHEVLVDPHDFEFKGMLYDDKFLK